jgi:hypothetical protein
LIGVACVAWLADALLPRPQQRRFGGHVGRREASRVVGKVPAEEHERDKKHPDRIELTNQVGNVTMANIVEVAVVLAVIIVAIRFFTKRA